MTEKEMLVEKLVKDGHINIKEAMLLLEHTQLTCTMPSSTDRIYVSPGPWITDRPDYNEIPGTYTTATGDMSIKTN